MEKNKFITGTVVLLIGGLITKIFGFIIKIVYTRLIGEEGISLYSLIVPTYSLIVTIAGFGMPMAISKLVAEKKKRSKDIMVSSIYILLTINFITMLIFILASGFIANNLLNAPVVKVLLIGSTLAMPNMALACIFKGYYYGKQMMIPNTISNIIEQTIRILFVIFIMPYFLKKSLICGILSFILITIVTEGASILTFILFLPKHAAINISDLKFDKSIASDLMDTSVPLISGKIIGSIGFFFEPIILSNTMKNIGYSQDAFIKEYGIYNGYSMSLLLLPTFFIVALSTSIVPEIAKYYGNGNYKMIKRRSKQAINISLIFGILTTTIIFFSKKYLLMLIYNTNLGINYVSWLCLFFPLYYLEAPLSSILQALNEGKYVMKTTTIGVFIKLITMFLFTLLHIGLYGLIISEFINILYIVIANGQKLHCITKKELI
jgi:stage V sporulation protein B